MGRVEIVAASSRHIGRIARHMRDIDRLECQAMGHDPKQALRAGLHRSVWSLTALVDGQPEAMFGVVSVSILDGVGVPWMLGTNAVYRHPRAMLVTGRRVVGMMRGNFGKLENMVAERNAPAIRMLKRWGFSVEQGAEDRGGVAFLRFAA